MSLLLWAGNFQLLWLGLGWNPHSLGVINILEHYCRGCSWLWRQRTLEGRLVDLDWLGFLNFLFRSNLSHQQLALSFSSLALTFCCKACLNVYQFLFTLMIEFALRVFFSLFIRFLWNLHYVLLSNSDFDFERKYKVLVWHTFFCRTTFTSWLPCDSVYSNWFRLEKSILAIELRLAFYMFLCQLSSFHYCLCKDPLHLLFVLLLFTNDLVPVVSLG